ncbi:MAG: hypothetical protein ACLVJ6_06985 [Merdibacter sp.]
MTPHWQGRLPQQANISLVGCRYCASAGVANAIKSGGGIGDVAKPSPAQ